jgi:hypothetical protein
MKEEDFLDNYEKHLLKNGAEVDYEKTTRQQRERDLEELKRTKEEEVKNEHNN